MFFKSDDEEQVSELSLKKRAEKYLLLNPGRVAGGFLGLIIAVLIITIGILKTALIVFCVTSGCVIGGIRDKHEIRDRIVEQYKRFMKR